MIGAGSASQCLHIIRLFFVFNSPEAFNITQTLDGEDALPGLRILQKEVFNGFQPLMKIIPSLVSCR
jgi:hypothetical protein